MHMSIPTVHCLLASSQMYPRQYFSTLKYYFMVCVMRLIYPNIVISKNLVEAYNRIEVGNIPLRSYEFDSMTLFHLDSR